MGFILDRRLPGSNRQPRTLHAGLREPDQFQTKRAVRQTKNSDSCIIQQKHLASLSWNFLGERNVLACLRGCSVIDTLVGQVKLIPKHHYL